MHLPAFSFLRYVELETVSSLRFEMEGASIQQSLKISFENYSRANNTNNAPLRRERCWWLAIGSKMTRRAARASFPPCKFLQILINRRSVAKRFRSGCWFSHWGETRGIPRRLEGKCNRSSRKGLREKSRLRDFPFLFEFEGSLCVWLPRLKTVWIVKRILDLLYDREACFFRSIRFLGSGLSRFHRPPFLAVALFHWSVTRERTAKPARFNYFPSFEPYLGTSGCTCTFTRPHFSRHENRRKHRENYLDSFPNEFFSTHDSTRAKERGMIRASADQ